MSRNPAELSGKKRRQYLVRTLTFMALGIGTLMLISATDAWAQPSIRAGGVVNASSYLPDIARGSWFVIFGTGLGPTNLSVFSGTPPYPTELSGTRVTFTPVSGGSAVDTRMWYTSATQLAALLPSSVPAGDYDVRVIFNNQTSGAARARVVERNFGFATQSQNGQGPAQATYGGLDLNRFTTGTLANYSTRPAKTGDAMILWGTGLGADTASDLNGGTSGDQTAAAQARVIVGGIEVTPVYAGRSNGSPGLDQINFTVPSGVTPGCFVSISVRVGGRTSNLGTIAVAEPGQPSCSSPTLTSAQLTQLDQGRPLTFGALVLTKQTINLSVPGAGSFDSTTETAGGSFSRYSIDAVATSPFGVSQTGACTVYRRTGNQQEISSLTPTTLVNLDAGAQLTLNGPNASNKAIRRLTGNVYSETLYSSGFSGIGGSGTPTLGQGTYTIAGTGGADIGPFTARLDVPGNFRWTNQATVPAIIPRSTGLNITWEGGGTGLVTITGVAAASAGGTQTNPIFDAAVFTCLAQASAGNFTVPATVLQQLPAVSADVTSGSVGLLSVNAAPAPNTGSFTAPLTAGGNVDNATFLYAIGSSKSVGFN
jgi:uncharacterized protein (TIGR03437 family)